MKIFRTYFDKTLDQQVQFFNLVTLLGMVSGVCAAIIATILREHSAIFLDLSISLFSFILFYTSRIWKHYNLYSWIMIIIIFIIMFPGLFFFSGGHEGGAICFFMVAIVYTSYILEKRARIVALTLESIIYIISSLIDYHIIGETVVIEPEQMYAVDATVNFLFAGVLLIVAVMFRARLHNNRQMQIQELNRELEARNETLVRYDKMKGDFLGTVAHEINTPLAIIAASSQDTLDLLHAKKPNIDEITENQKIIGERVKLIDNILLDLMDTVAIENGRLSLERQYVVLSEFLWKTCDSQFRRLDVNNNQLTYDMMPGLPKIWADPSRLEQVVVNLLSNATRYTKNGVITVRLAQAEKKQIVSVIDNGEGMDKEIAKIVLKQYFSTKADYWRHGIGLSVCRQIIAAHDGEIWVESEKGRGTNVSFSLKENEENE